MTKTDITPLCRSPAWRSRRGDDGTDPPDVLFTDISSLQAVRDTSENAYIFDRFKVVGEISGPYSQERQEFVEGRLAKIAQILAVYGLLDDLSIDEQTDLLAAIRQILQAYET